jgi:putative FmdB family regulatory protein
VPTYQYRCTACGEPLEAVQSFDDDPLSECPSCGGPLRKLFSSVGVVFKGSGFYRTDSRAGSSSTPAATDGKPAAGASDSKGGSKPDTKPAKKETTEVATTPSSSTPSAPAS